MGINVRTQEEHEIRRAFEELRQQQERRKQPRRLRHSSELEGFNGNNGDKLDHHHHHQTEKVVCVTSGVSFLGLAIVNRLLLRGYSVRILLDNQGDVEKVREMEVSRACNNRISTVMMAKPLPPTTEDEIQGRLMEAFDGCGGVFHTSAWADPAGISGYSKSMAEIEVKACENVIKACARTPSVRKCVLTSSLLACIWKHYYTSQLEPFPLVNHHCWSDESVCIDKKLWYALGKLKAEKVAWRLAEEMGLKLTTICPGLITGPQFSSTNPTATIAYLKGGQEMYAKGLLATVDVSRVAEAHVGVFEAMSKTGAAASGRYICFDQVIEREEEAEELAREIGMPPHKICGGGGGGHSFIPTRFELSNHKLANLMSTTLRSCYAEN